jgi:hypothetical protein
LTAITYICRCSFEQISFHPQAGVLPPQLGQLGPLRRGHPGALAPVDAGLAHPAPQRAVADAQSNGHVDDLIAIVEHHRHGVTLELVGERAPGSCPLLLHY